MTNSKEEQWKDAQEHFDAAAKTWDEKPRRIALAKAIGEAIFRTVDINPAMEVMDFGTGTGLLAFQLAPHVASVIAADKSRNMLAVVDEKAGTGEVKNILTLDMSVDVPKNMDGRFDLIVTAMVLHHVKAVNDVLADFTKWLKPGGQLAIADLSPEDGTFHDSDAGTVHHGLDPELLAEVLNAMGLTTSINPAVHQIEKNGQLYSVFLLSARK